MTLGRLRISDRAVSKKDTVALLRRALVGRIGTVDADGMPYVVPLNFVYEHTVRRVHLHFGKNPGHLALNLKFSSKVCFEVDDPGAIIATGQTACETDHVYESVVCFGRAQLVSDERERARIARLFVRKYIRGQMPPRSYKPDLVYMAFVDFVSVEIEVMTGKRRPPL